MVYFCIFIVAVYVLYKVRDVIKRMEDKEDEVEMEDILRDVEDRFGEE